ncbi:hypothetical protein SAMN05216388_1005186 [Halorientalis persicus]|jgi:hypothetical protein|uniref:Uncharacterized protein n=1 Tax=Halorientalis persicus TaxID=1367881 RepID=A0A1H8JWC2_9EURY|nr:hypothetical protein [Halorientalis persicus]SEN84518.1 hypothetical protein SAMN05216388_1005186 [Halorientalis persicus]
MADITLFELHLDDATFSNSAPFVGGEDDAEGAEAEAADESGSGAAGKLYILLALGAIVGLAWLVSRSEVGEGIEIDEEIELTS